MKEAIDKCIKNIKKNWALYIKNMPDDFYQDFAIDKERYIDEYYFYL